MGIHSNALLVRADSRTRIYVVIQCDCFGIQYDHRNNVCYLWSFAKSYDAHHWSSLYWNFPNIPLLVIAMFFYVIIPMYVAKIDGFYRGDNWANNLYLVIHCETVRAGIQSVDPGQMEGARANGMTYWQAMSKLSYHRHLKSSFHRWAASLLIWWRTLLS